MGYGHELSVLSDEICWQMKNRSVCFIESGIFEGTFK